MPHPRNNVLAAVAFGLAALLIIAFYDVVFLDKTFKVTTANSQALPTGAFGQEENKPPFIPVNGTDAPVLEEPVYAFLKHWLWQGDLPLWNPHQAGGFSLIAMIQVGIFYPLNAIMYLLPETFAWDVLILTRLFLAGLFTVLFMRRMGASAYASLAAGIAFMLSGPMVLLQYWTANVDILLPLLLISSDRLIEKPSARNTALAALAVALTFYAGHPEHVFLVNLCNGLFFFYRSFSAPGRQRFRSFALFGGANLIGLGLSAAVLLPFLQHHLFEFWNGHPDGTGLLMEEQRHRALTLAIPHFFQKEPLTYQWEFAGWWGGYLGTLPLALAFVSLFSRHQRSIKIFFAAMAFLLISKEYGLPYINWIGHLPVFDVCRYAIHTPTIVAFAVAVLAGWGVDAIRDKKESVYPAVLFSGGLMLVACAHAIILSQSELPSTALPAIIFCGTLLFFWLIILWLRQSGRFGIKSVSILLLLLLFTELFCYIHRERPKRFASFGEVPYIEFLKQQPGHFRSYGMFWAFYPNTATGFQVDDLGYFFGMVPNRFVDYVNTLLLADHFKRDLRPPALRAVPVTGAAPFLDILNVKYFIAPPTARLTRLIPNFAAIRPLWNIVYDKEVSIIERASVLPRAFIVHRAAFVTDQDKTFQIMKRLGKNLAHIAIINHPVIPQIMAELQASPPTDNSLAKITATSPDQVTLQVKMEHAGLLVLSDAFHPDWNVFVNGEPSQVFQTHHLIRSVFLPAGEFEVRFEFRPQSFLIGKAVSAAFFLVILILLGWDARAGARSPVKPL